MKKIKLLLLACLAIQVGFSQITITNNDLIDAGYYAVMGSDTSLGTSLTPGQAGPNQSWDFSALTHSFKDTTWFMMPDWTPYATHFPNANFAGFGLGEDMYMYFYRDNLEFSLVGVVMYFAQLGDYVAVPFDPKETIIRFPANYNDSYTNNFSQEIIIASPIPTFDSMKVVLNVSKTTTIDAWGTITTPLDAFASLRIKDERTQTTQVWALAYSFWTMISSTDETIYSYSWWSDDPTTGFPVMEMFMDANNMYVNSYNFLAEPTMMNIAEGDVGISVKLYPNPTSDVINIDFSENTTAIIQLVNISGQVVKKYNFKGIESELNLGSLPPGLYTLIIYEQEGLKSSSFKVCLQ